MTIAADTRARNVLFEHGTALGLTWTRGEAADGTPSIYLPLRDATAARGTISLHAANWILRWTSPARETETVRIDKLSRDIDELMRALAAAVGLVVDETVESEPATALEFIRFLGALGIAIDDDSALAAATAGRARAREVLAGEGV